MTDQMIRTARVRAFSRTIGVAVTEALPELAKELGVKVPSDRVLRRRVRHGDVQAATILKAVGA